MTSHLSLLASRLFLAFAALLLGACATTGSDPRDPWEGMNRKTFAFNDAADRAILKPLAQGYESVLPGFVRTGVNNFYENIADVATGLNNVLQGKPNDGISDLGRVVLNTIFGVAGIFDVATEAGLEKHNEDFGQTLGVWGVPPGPYFVIPFLGPSTARDAPARVVDPSWYYSRAIDNPRVWWSFWTLDQVRIRANLLKAESVLDEAALDKYQFLRDAWLQRRRSQVYDGNPPRVKEEE
jgi:phospholipid-binding lipoprotein MlaA